MRRVLIYDRFDAPVCELAHNDVFELLNHQEINGEHSLSITTTEVLSQGDRVLMEDDRGYWHEWVIYGTDSLHESGNRPYGTYYCVWSVQPDLMGTRISAMPGVQSACPASDALTAVVSGTARWTKGTVTNTNTGGASMYDTDGWTGMSTLLETWGGEVDVSITVGSTGVTARSVDLYSQQGDQTPKRRYDFGADLKSVRRTLEDGPLYCRITPRGKGEESGAGYGRKITIEDVNSGKDYLEYAPMVDLAKLPDGNGGWEYPTLEIENSDCETPASLKAWAQSVIEECLLPKITYEVDVLQAAREGIDLQGVSLGDAVHIVDRKFNLRLTGRVVMLERDEIADAATTLTIGYIGGGLSSRFSNLDSRVTRLTSTVQAINGGTLSTADYLDRLLDRLNTEINATGGYTYIVPGHGILTYDVAVADPLDPTEASSVVEIKGGTIRIANTKDPYGNWEWKTVFVSGHVAAEVVTAANLVAGYIGNVSGNYWNLDTGELIMKSASGVVLDDTDLETLLQNVDSTITGVDVQYAQNTSATTAPTSGWSTTAPAWQEGYYIWQRTMTTTPSGTYPSTPVMISGRDGSDGTSVTILGSYNSLADLQTAHPTGNTGDSYIVGDDLYVWNGSAWEDVGAIRGPQGPSGTDGADGSQIWTATANPTTPNYTFALSALTGPSGVSPKVGDLVVRSYYRYTISSVGSTSVLAGSRTSIRGSAGATGATGATGNGVSQIVEQYYLSTSSSTQTGGSWTTSQPAWSDGKYIWTRSYITWTDGDTSYTDPVLAQAINGANENASTAITEAAKANAVVRSYNSGVLVCRNTNMIGALINADGSFDVVKVTWSDGIPTAGDALARFSESQIWLGKNSTSSVIDLCSGSATMGITTNGAFWTDLFTIKSTHGVVCQWYGDGTTYQNSGQYSFVECFYTGYESSRKNGMIRIQCGDNVNSAIDAGLLITGRSYSGTTLDGPAMVSSNNQYVELYSNSSGTTGGVSLSWSIVKFNHINIYYRGNDGYENCTTISRIESSTDCYADLSVVESTTNGSLNIKSRRVKLSGKNITNMSYAEMDNGNTPSSTNNVKITRVEGWTDISIGG